jgi:predicted unusual protein kinase regulating ubiquinone biosynthesis (AarF/ABC1/UbiB family)
VTDTPSSPPTGRWGRAARLLTLAGTGRALARDPAAATEKLAEVLGSLRGIAAKGAQLASYVDGVVPPEHEALFEATLGRLRAQAPRTPPDQARALVEAELGGPLSALFRDFEAEARASGSLGQVHRATLLDGRAVAVKVQHAGMAEAVEADLANMATLEALVGPLGGRRHGTEQVVALLSARFREELDYRREASHLTEFTALHAGDPTIRVPAVIPERSAGRVLTTEWVEGLTLAEAAQQPEEMRRTYAETLWRFVFVSNFVGHRFNADPHPGNYVFRPAVRCTSSTSAASRLSRSRSMRPCWPCTWPRSSRTSGCCAERRHSCSGRAAGRPKSGWWPTRARCWRRCTTRPIGWSGPTRHGCSWSCRG